MIFWPSRRWRASATAAPSSARIWELSHPGSASAWRRPMFFLAASSPSNATAGGLGGRTSIRRWRRFPRRPTICNPRRLLGRRRHRGESEARIVRAPRRGGRGALRPFGQQAHAAAGPRGRGAVAGRVSPSDSDRLGWTPSSPWRCMPISRVRRACCSWSSWTIWPARRIKRTFPAARLQYRTGAGAKPACLTICLPIRRRKKR